MCVVNSFRLPQLPFGELCFLSNLNAKLLQLIVFHFCHWFDLFLCKRHLHLFALLGSSFTEDVLPVQCRITSTGFELLVVVLDHAAVQGALLGRETLEVFQKFLLSRHPTLDLLKTPGKNKQSSLNDCLSMMIVHPLRK